MKKWLLIFLLLQSTFILLAQQSVFQLDSLPPDGIRLREGWKFHAGDNPEWAKANFDDSTWEASQSLEGTWEVTSSEETGTKNEIIVPV